MLLWQRAFTLSTRYGPSLVTARVGLRHQPIAMLTDAKLASPENKKNGFEFYLNSLSHSLK